MKKKCATSYCRNKVTPSKDGRFCSTCRSRKHRKNSPYKYFYQKVRYSAKRRSKPFDICLEQFKLIWLCEPEKWQEKINGPDNCTWEMDRIRENEGYHFDNIQLIKKRKNVQKYYNQKNQFQLEVSWEEVKSPDTSDAPF